MGAVTMETDNPIAEKNRELALRRKLEGLPREKLIERCIRLKSEVERAWRQRDEVADDLDDVVMDLYALSDAYAHRYQPDPQDKKRWPEHDGPCVECGLFPWHRVHNGAGGTDQEGPDDVIPLPVGPKEAPDA